MKCPSLKIKLFLLVTLLSGCVAAQAGVSVQFAVPAQCSNLVGTWTGDATVVAASGIVTCFYSGKAVFTENSPLEAKPYKVALTFDFASGHFLCPAHQEVNLGATCDNDTGEIIVDAKDKYKVKGHVDPSGEKINLDGEVNITDYIVGDFKADLNKVHG